MDMNSFALNNELFYLLLGVSLIIYIAAYWLIFEEVGLSPWYILIPFYNVYLIVTKIAKIKPMWFFIPLIFAAFIPISMIIMMTAGSSHGSGNYGIAIGLILMFIAMIVIVTSHVQIVVGICRSYDRSIPFAIGLLVFNPIFIAVIAYNPNIRFIDES